MAGGTGAEYLDAPRLLPFWEAAAALGVPVYLHPRPAFDQRIYEGHSQLIGATWGFAPEAATHALRLVFSGLFDRFPSLTLVLGHLGETLPYFAWRIQHCFEFNPADKRLQRRLQDYLCDNFYVSTSGFFNDQALIGAVLTIGADRILFAVDYPYEPMDPAAAWIERAPISEIDRRKIAHLNARTLFRLPLQTLSPGGIPACSIRRSRGDLQQRQHSHPRRAHQLVVRNHPVCGGFFDAYRPGGAAFRAHPARGLWRDGTRGCISYRRAGRARP